MALGLIMISSRGIEFHIRPNLADQFFFNESVYVCMYGCNSLIRRLVIRGFEYLILILRTRTIS